jgi:hypothetical protein
MNVTYNCPHCEHDVRTNLAPGAAALVCPRCRAGLEVPDGAIVDGEVRHCLACPSTDLFVRKDFPQRLGVTIVAVGFLLSCITWYFYWLYATFAVLFATALVDVVLYAVVGEVLTCYRCGAAYRHAESPEKHGPFNLETHERYRQQAARLAESGVQAARPASRAPAGDTSH